MPPKQFETVWKAEPHTIAKVALITAGMPVPQPAVSPPPRCGCAVHGMGHRRRYGHNMIRLPSDSGV